MAKIENWAEKHRHELEIVFVILVGLYVFYWSTKKEFNRAPDEYMRYGVCKYIFEHGKLPLGDDPELLVGNIWGFSYAFMPTWLGSLLSAFFMKVVSVIHPGVDDFTLLVAARFASVVGITGCTYFMLRSFSRLFDVFTEFLLAILVALIPQFTYLGSYVNWDSLCLCGASMILYAWVLGIQDGWNKKNSILLSLGIVVVVLTYYFGYGWVLGSIIFYFASYWFEIGKNRRQDFRWKNVLMICVIVLGLTGFFLIRNVVLYHDLLGRNAMAASQRLHGDPAYFPETFKGGSLKYQGYDIFVLFRMPAWWETTFLSFIGCFGYMEAPVPGQIWGVYLYVFVLLFCGFLGSFVMAIKNHEKEAIFLNCFLLFEIVLTVALSYWYSYASDYQPQGRYIYSMLPALGASFGIGYRFDRTRQGFVSFISVFYILTIIYKSVSVFLNF